MTIKVKRLEVDVEIATYEDGDEPILSAQKRQKGEELLADLIAVTESNLIVGTMPSLATKEG